MRREQERERRHDSWSAVSRQPSAVSRQPSAVSRQRSAVSRQRSKSSSTSSVTGCDWQAST
ncbi:hypothetical protein E6R18_17915 [Streptomyces sp. A1277]|nr:hypothetical protein E6R18_17915 [Streptomyces sp. A1277]